jgi:hypothetical protein
MAVDSSIYGLIKQFRPVDPMESYGKALTIGNMVNQQGLQDLQRRQMERGIADDDATRAAYQEAGGDPKKIRDLLYSKGLYKPAQAVEKSMLDREKTQAELQKTRVETFAAAAKQMRDALAGVNDDNGMVGLRETALRLYGPDVVSKMGIPDRFDPKWKEGQLLTADKLLDRTTPKYEKVDVGGRVEMIDTNPFTNPAIKGTKFDKTMTPGERDASARGWAGLTETKRHNAATEGTQGVPAGYRRTADGNLEPIPGGPATAKATSSDTERVSAGYASRMAASGKILDELEKQNVGKPEWAETIIGVGMDAGGLRKAAANASMSTNRQKYRQAQEDWVRAKLRKESGAVIADDEMDREIRVYFPQIGDDPATVKQKADSRKIAEQSMRQAAGRAPVAEPGGGIKFLGFE